MEKGQKTTFRLEKQTGRGFPVTKKSQDNDGTAYFEEETKREKKKRSKTPGGQNKQFDTYGGRVVALAKN